MKIDSKKPVENPGKKVRENGKARGKKKSKKNEFDEALEKAKAKITEAETAIAHLALLTHRDRRIVACKRFRLLGKELYGINQKIR